MATMPTTSPVQELAQHSVRSTRFMQSMVDRTNALIVHRAISHIDSGNTDVARNLLKKLAELLEDSAKAVEETEENSNV